MIMVSNCPDHGNQPEHGPATRTGLARLAVKTVEQMYADRLCVPMAIAKEGLCYHLKDRVRFSWEESSPPPREPGSSWSGPCAQCGGSVAPTLRPGADRYRAWRFSLDMVIANALWMTGLYAHIRFGIHTRTRPQEHGTEPRTCHVKLRRTFKIPTTPRASCLRPGPD